jgi:hypothetical protein
MADKKLKKTKKGKASSASIGKKEEAPSGLQMLYHLNLQKQAS